MILDCLALILGGLAPFLGYLDLATKPVDDGMAGFPPSPTGAEEAPSSSAPGPVTPVSFHLVRQKLEGDQEVVASGQGILCDPV